MYVNHKSQHEYRMKNDYVQLKVLSPKLTWKIFTNMVFSIDLQIYIYIYIDKDYINTLFLLLYIIDDVKNRQ